MELSHFVIRKSYLPTFLLSFLPVFYLYFHKSFGPNTWQADELRWRMTSNKAYVVAYGY